MTTTTGAAPMSAEEVLASMQAFDAADEWPSDLAVLTQWVAAVSAMSEREAALVKEVEALAVRLKALESEVSSRRAGWASFVDDEDPSLLVVAHQDRPVHFTGASAWDDANAFDAARAEARDGK